MASRRKGSGGQEDEPAVKRTAARRKKSDAKRITYELEELKKAGVNAAYILEIGARAGDAVPSGPAYFSPDSLKAIGHAVREDRADLRPGAGPSRGLRRAVAGGPVAVEGGQ